MPNLTCKNKIIDNDDKSHLRSICSTVPYLNADYQQTVHTEIYVLLLVVLLYNCKLKPMNCWNPLWVDCSADYPLFLLFSDISIGTN